MGIAVVGQGAGSGAVGATPGYGAITVGDGDDGYALEGAIPQPLILTLKLDNFPGFLTFTR
jgi:hypothetical protein